MAMYVPFFHLLGGVTRQVFFTSSRVKLTFFLLRSITNSVSDRLTNFPDTFFLPVFLSQPRVFLPPATGPGDPRIGLELWEIDSELWKIGSELWAAAPSRLAR
jgi:hypothetical protein